MKLTDQPVAYSVAIKAVLALLVILGVVELTPEQVAQAALTADALLAIFVWRAVTPNAKAEEAVDDAAFIASAFARTRALEDVAQLAPAPKPPAVKKAPAKRVRKAVKKA